MARLSRRFGFALILCLAAAAANAQPLTQALCPAGSPFKLAPLFTQFHSGDPGIPLLKRTIDTSVFPNAVCNDGSAAVMYIRPAHANYGNNPITVATNKWLIFLDGGGGCRNAEDCLTNRWCSGSSAIFDRAGKMSSLGLYNAIKIDGIFNLKPAAPAVNFFADFNHVIVHYCSSDTWIGSSQHTAVTNAAGTNFDIQFQGEAIVNAVISTLSGGGVGADHPLEFLFYDTVLPPLTNASEILLGGESAGGGGLRHHLDRLAAELDLIAMNPNVKIRGVIDAGFSPGEWDPAINWDDPLSPPTSYSDQLRSMVSTTSRGWWGADNSALDSSCLDPAHAAAHVAVGGSHPEICLDTTYTLLNHITTPFFLRMDIDDFLAKEKYLDWSMYPSSADYWLAQYNQLALLASYRAGLGGLEGPDDFPGVQGPNCGIHVVIQKDSGFYRHRVLGPGLPQLSFHDLLVNWFTGGAPGVTTQQIQVDNPAGGAYTASFCP